MAAYSKVSLLLLGLLFTVTFLSATATSDNDQPGEDAEKTRMQVEAIRDSKDTATYRGYMQSAYHDLDDDDDLYQYGGGRGRYGYPRYGSGGYGGLGGYGGYGGRGRGRYGGRGRGRYGGGTGRYPRYPGYRYGGGY